MEHILDKMRRYISPVFLSLLVASFILWYIAKLGYTYTTEQVMQINVDGREFEVTCVVEGVGTNLFGYRVYMNKTLKVPLTELKFVEQVNEQGQTMLEIDRMSLQSAISVRMSDIKVISIGEVPQIEQPSKDD